MRFLLAAVSLLVLGAAAHAGGADDLAAAKAAADKGVRDDAIRLYTQAIGVGDLKPDDQAAALRGRGGEYTAKSMIADAFDKRDEGRRLRDNAIADFDAALKLKTDDADLYATRAQVEHMNGLFDKAIVDFDASLKLKSSVLTLTQRAASKRANGDYDGAAADYATALATTPKDGGLDDADILDERGYSSFLAGRFDAAADDFSKATTADMAERAADVLWLPYQTAWLHIARARAGKDDSEALKAEASRLDLAQWPGTVVAYFLGQTTLDKVSGGSTHGMSGRGRECALSFFAAEQALVKGDKVAAAPMLDRAKEVCNPHTVYALAARVESARLAK